MITEELKSALTTANDIYQRGYEEGQRVGYRQGFAEATRRATELIDKTLGPLVEEPKEPS